MVFWKFSWYWEQKLTIFVNLLLKKTAHVQLGYHNWDTNWEYTLTPLSLYSESGVKVCCSHQLWSFFLFFTVLESCIRYHFSLIFRASCNIIWKIDFCPKFPFFNRFPQTPHHLNDQNLLSLTSFLLMLPKCKSTECSVISCIYLSASMLGIFAGIVNHDCIK